tara:strand:- start:454 stop:1134 length:681 start_codon:yes stop_codon:yes gene_type:complete
VPLRAVAAAPCVFASVTARAVRAAASPSSREQPLIPTAPAESCKSLADRGGEFSSVPRDTEFIFFNYHITEYFSNLMLFNYDYFSFFAALGAAVRSASAVAPPLALLLMMLAVRSTSAAERHQLATVVQSSSPAVPAAATQALLAAKSLSPRALVSRLVSLALRLVLRLKGLPGTLLSQAVTPLPVLLDLSLFAAETDLSVGAAAVASRLRAARITTIRRVLRSLF